MKVALYGGTGNSGKDILNDLLARKHTVTAIVRYQSKLDPEEPDDLIGATERLIAGVKQSDVERLLTVGGAGTLEVSPGTLLVDSSMLPEAWKPIAKAHVKALELLRTSELDWTCLAPAAFFEPGEKTNVFRLGLDNLIVGENGESRISMEDYAVALVDELEKHKHSRQRFSIGY